MDGSLGIIIILVISLVISFVAGLGEALRIKDVSKYSSAWHWLQLVERIGFILLGALIVTISKTFFGIIVLLLFAGLIFWTIYDGLINVIARNSWFFDTSETSKAITEPFAKWYVKLPLVLLFFIINFIVELNEIKKERNRQ